MPDIRHIVLSDLHLGADNSILTQPGDVPGASPALDQLALCLRDLARGAAAPPQLIINGDVLELALCTAAPAIGVFRSFIQALTAGGEWPFHREIVFLPGNHDHHLWEMTREDAWLRRIANVEPDKPFRDAEHASPLLLGHSAFTDPLLTGVLHSLPATRDCVVITHYPNLALTHASGRTLLLHHGHYIEPIYSAMAELRCALFPGTRLPTHVHELEAQNYAWIDFLWSTLGRSGRAGADLELIYDKLQDEHAIAQLVRRLVNDLTRKGGGSRVEDAVLATAFDLVVRRVARREVVGSGGMLGDAARAGLRSYAEGPLLHQLRTELGAVPEETALTVGHTHRPFEASTQLSGYSGDVALFNTGGFVVDTVQPDPLHGGSLLVIDDELHVGVIRLYNEITAGPPLPVRVFSASAALADALRARIDPRAEPWSGFTRHAAEGVAASRALLQRHIAQQGEVKRTRHHRHETAATALSAPSTQGAPAAAPAESAALRAPRHAAHERTPLQTAALPSAATAQPATRQIRLASLPDTRADHYDVVVIGSGYGGSIAAARLARAGRQVCVLERGKEFQPGEYPHTVVNAAREVQIGGGDVHVGPRNGLYEFHVGPDIGVFKGCGLGGTSLVNANVSLRAEPRVFQDPRWPKELRQDASTLVEESYERAEQMLRPVPYPDSQPKLPKLAALETSARFLHEKFYRPPINVTFETGVNHVGVHQSACTGCGDCCTGCNYGAKNTLIMNYLPDAVEYGAKIFTDIDVRYLEQRGEQWLIWFQELGTGREKFGDQLESMTANLVVLGAGALGSTEILLRSQQKGLSLSKQVGHRFTGNGDVLAWAYNAPGEIRGVGWGAHAPASADAPGPAPAGPCIAGIIDIRNQPELKQGMVIEEGVIPGALAPLLPEMFDVIGGVHAGAVERTQTYLVMSHDDDAGRLELEHDRLAIRWPHAGEQPVFRYVNEKLREAARAIGAQFVKDPIWSERFGDKVITVHPLGGCIMAERAKDGVVNHKGQVFRGSSGNAVYENLYVCDGAVIPVALGVNPLLTISALAERCAALIARDRGWHIDYTLRPRALPTVQLRTGVAFTERMAGSWTRDGTAPSPLSFTLTIQADDLDALLSDPEHRATIRGTVTAPALHPAPLDVTHGEFQLFSPDATQQKVLHMRYRMSMHAVDGRAWFFDGIKTMTPASPLHIWHDTTTLQVTISEGDAPGGRIVGTGVLRISPYDFMKQLSTMKVLNASDAKERLRANAKFGGFFAGALFETYVKR